MPQVSASWQINCWCWCCCCCCCCCWWCCCCCCLHKPWPACEPCQTRAKIKLLHFDSLLLNWQASSQMSNRLVWLLCSTAMCPCLISPQEVPQVFPNRPNHLALQPSAPEQRLLVTFMREHIDFMGKGTVDRFTKSDLKRQTWMLSYVSICQLCQFTKKRSQWNGFVWKKRNWGNWLKLPPSLGTQERGHGALLWPAALADSAPAFGTPIWSDGSAPVTKSLDSQSCYRDVFTLILIDWCICRGVSKTM